MEECSTRAVCGLDYGLNGSVEFLTFLVMNKKPQEGLFVYGGERGI